MGYSSDISGIIESFRSRITQASHLMDLGQFDEVISELEKIQREAWQYNIPQISALVEKSLKEAQTVKNLTKMFEISSKLKIDDICEELKYNRGEVMKIFFDWGKKLGLNIEGDLVSVNNNDHSDSISRPMKKYNMYISLGDYDFERKNYEDSLKQYKDAINIATDELIEPSLIIQARELLEKAQKIITEEKDYKDFYLQAVDLVKGQQWIEARDLWEKILNINSDLFRNNKKETILKQIEECNNKIQEKEKHEKYYNLLSSAKELQKNGNYIDSKAVWEQVLEFSVREGWNDLQEGIIEYTRECDELILLSNENLKIVKKGDTAFINEKFEQSISYFEQSQKICRQYGWQDGIRNSNEMIEKCRGKLNESFSYHGIILKRLEFNFMMELEKMVSLPIPFLPGKTYIGWNTFGFYALNKHVVGLGLYEKNLSSLPESIGSLTALTYLDLNSNQLSSLPETIGSLKSLTKLNLSWNQISSLPETIGSLTALTTLDLNGNKISSLPESIGTLKSLKEIRLYNNKISSLPETIKKWLKDLKEKGCTIYQ